MMRQGALHLYSIQYGNGPDRKRQKDMRLVCNSHRAAGWKYVFMTHVITVVILRGRMPFHTHRTTAACCSDVDMGTDKAPLSPRINARLAES